MTVTRISYPVIPLIYFFVPSVYLLLKAAEDFSVCKDQPINDL